MRISTYNCLSSHYIPKNKGDISEDGTKCIAYGCSYDHNTCELHKKNQTQYERIEPMLQKIKSSDVFFLQELEQETYLEIRKAHQEAHQEVWDAVYEPRYDTSRSTIEVEESIFDKIHYITRTCCNYNVPLFCL